MGEECAAEGLDVVLGFPAGAVGDLFAEVLSLSELFADDVDDVLAVAVVLGEDEGLGHTGFVEAHGLGPGGAVDGDLGEEFFPESSDDGADLIADGDAAGGVEVDSGDVLDSPTRGAQLSVDCDAG